MNLRRVGGKWKVVWSPSVIHTALKPGQRLAIVTEEPKRAPVTDTHGRSLMREVGAYDVGVYPGQLADPKKTLDLLAERARFEEGRRLDAERLLGRVRSAPPQDFLPLLTLQVPAHNALLQRLSGIPGLKFNRVKAPIAPAYAAELVGTLGPATADRLQQVGAPTSPATRSASAASSCSSSGASPARPPSASWRRTSPGRTPRELRSWEGSRRRRCRPPRPVLPAQGGPGAGGPAAPGVHGGGAPSTGRSSPSNHGTGRQNLAFEGKYPPGMTFGIVRQGPVHAGEHEPVERDHLPASVTVGGETVTNQAGATASFANHFAASCKTTLAQLSTKLTGRP